MGFGVDSLKRRPPNPLWTHLILFLVDVSDNFLFFPARGGGRGSPRPSGGRGVDFLLKIRERGGGSPGRAEGPGGCLRGIGELWGGGAIYIYIYISAVRLLSGPSLALLEVIIWSKFVFSKTPIAKKHYKNRGFSLFCLEKNCAQKFWKLLSGPSWRFLRCSQLGPDNNFQLGPDNNFQKCHFFSNFLL